MHAWLQTFHSAQVRNSRATCGMRRICIIITLLYYTLPKLTDWVSREMRRLLVCSAADASGHRKVGWVFFAFIADQCFRHFLLRECKWQGGKVHAIRNPLEFRCEKKIKPIRKCLVMLAIRVSTKPYHPTSPNLMGGPFFNESCSSSLVSFIKTGKINQVFISPIYIPDDEAPEPLFLTSHWLNNGS